MESTHKPGITMKKHIAKVDPKKEECTCALETMKEIGKRNDGTKIIYDCPVHGVVSKPVIMERKVKVVS
jgi:hypothetical protein